MYTKSSHNLYYAFSYVIFLSSLGQIAADLYLPSLPAIQTDFNSNINTIQLSVACFMYGYGFMQIFYGPISDAYGRKPPLLVGLIITLIGVTLAMEATCATTLLIGRLLQGIGAASCNAIYKASIRDLFQARFLAKVSSYFAVLTVLAIAAAPLLGGYIQEMFGWRWNFFALFVYTFFVIILVSLTPETNRFKDKSHIDSKIIYTNLKTLITHRVYMVSTLSTLLCYGGLLSWLTVGPFLIEKVLGFSALEFGYMSCAVGLFFALGGTLNSMLVTLENAIKMMRFGFSLMSIAAFSLFISSFFTINVYSILTCVILFSFGSSFVVPNAMALCLQPFKKMAGLAGAFFGFVKNLGGAIICSLIALSPDTDQVPLAVAYILISLIGITLVFKFLPKHNTIIKAR